MKREFDIEKVPMDTNTFNIDIINPKDRFIRLMSGEKLDLNKQNDRQEVIERFYTGMEELKNIGNALTLLIGWGLLQFTKFQLYKDDGWNTQEEWLENDPRLPFGRAWCMEIMGQWRTFHYHLEWTPTEMAQVGPKMLQESRSVIDRANNEELKSYMLSEGANHKELAKKFKDPERLMVKDIGEEVYRLQEGIYLLKRVKTDDVDFDGSYISEELSDEYKIFRTKSGTPFLKKGVSEH